MPYLIAGLVMVAMLCLVDLVLSLGVVRRLREHTERLNHLLADAGQRPSLTVGGVVADFSTTTVDGAGLCRDDLTGRSIIGFFSPGCQPCADQLPAFERRGGEPGWDRVIAVVVGETDEGEEVVRLRRLAEVVVEPHGGLVAGAFAVAGFPTIVELDDATVIASGHTVASTPTGLGR